MTVSKENVERGFTRAAATYDRFIGFQKESTRDFSEFIRSFAADSPKQILEAGCGTGALTARLAAFLPETSILSTDLSRGMIAFCREKFSGNSNLCFQSHDFDKPFACSSADWVVSALSLQWSSNISGALENLIKILRPGGRLLVSVPLRPSLFEIRNLFLSSGMNFPGLLLPEEADLRTFFENRLTETRMEVRVYRESYPSLTPLLESMRMNGTSGGNSGTPVSALKRLLRENSSRSVTAEYHVLMSAGRKKE